MAEEVLNDAEISESMDDTILETLREINAREESPPDAPDAPQDAAVSAPADKQAKARDGSGKFVKQDKGAPAPVVAAPALPGEPAAPVDGPDAPLTLPDGRPIDLTRPPSSFKPAAKAAWAQVPEAVRADIYRRESEHHAGYRGIKEAADFGTSISRVVEPYRGMIQAEGGTPERAIADTMRTAALFRTGSAQQKLEAIFQLDKQFNAGLSNHFQNAVQAEVARVTGQPAPNPQAQQQPALDPRVDTIMASMQAQERDRTQREEQISNAATERFLSSKGADGQPAYPFVDNVLQDMIDRTGAIRRSQPSLAHDDVLKQAYEQAVWANPETRAVLIGQQQAQAQQPAETLRKAEQVRRATAVNLPKRGALPATAPVGSMEDTIRETAKELGIF